MEDNDDSIIVWSTSEPGHRTEAVFDGAVGSDNIDVVRYDADDNIVRQYHGSIEELRLVQVLVQSMVDARRQAQQL